MPKTKEGKDHSKKPMTDQDRTEKESDDHGGQKSKDYENIKSGTKITKSRVKGEKGWQSTEAQGCWQKKKWRVRELWRKTRSDGATRGAEAPGAGRLFARAFLKVHLKF